MEMSVLNQLILYIPTKTSTYVINVTACKDIHLKIATKIFLRSSHMSKSWNIIWHRFSQK